MPDEPRLLEAARLADEWDLPGAIRVLGGALDAIGSSVGHRARGDGSLGVVQVWALFMERALADSGGCDDEGCDDEGCDDADWGLDLLLACRLAQSAGASGLATMLASSGADAVVVAETVCLLEDW